jgi:hypothetical protein
VGGGHGDEVWVHRHLQRSPKFVNLPHPDRVQADYVVLAELSRGLSGGDILNICLNAIHAGSVDADPERWVVTQEILEREIAKVKKAKAEHSGGAGQESEKDWVSVIRQIPYHEAEQIHRLVSLNAPDRGRPSAAPTGACRVVLRSIHPSS